MTRDADPEDVEEEVPDVVELSAVMVVADVAVPVELGDVVELSVELAELLVELLEVDDGTVEVLVTLDAPVLSAEEAVLEADELVVADVNDDEPVVEAELLRAVAPAASGWLEAPGLVDVAWAREEWPLAVSEASPELDVPRERAPELASSPEPDTSDPEEPQAGATATTTARGRILRRVSVSMALRGEGEARDRHRRGSLKVVPRPGGATSTDVGKPECRFLHLMRDPTVEA